MSEHLDNSGDMPLLVGGEMAYGSDAAAPLGVLTDLLREPLRSASSVLLIGPTAAGLAELCSTATVLVRRVADAERLTEHGLRVLVGGLERLSPDERAELVIQLDPPGRVLTPDSPGHSHLEVVALAARHVAPTGRLVALVPGPLGQDRANSPYVPGPNDDDAWWVGTSGYDDRPPTLRELPWQPGYFVVSTNGVPTVAATMDTLDTEVGRDRLRSACAPDDEASTALRGGVLADLADAWLLGCADGPAPASDVWAVPEEERTTRRRDGHDDRRVAALSAEVERRRAQARGLQALLNQQLRRVRALEHAMGTEHGPLARRTLLVMTAPVSRIVEAMRARSGR